MGIPAIEVWIETLRKIPGPEANPLEELSRQAPDVERTDKIEGVSSDDDEQEQETDTAQETEGMEENPVDVEILLSLGSLIVIGY